MSTTSKCIVVLGIASLQRYIFQSNRLRENIGASYLAKYWLDEGLIEAMQQTGYIVGKTAWDSYEKNLCTSVPREPEEGADIEIIYVGGGNAALLCKSQKIAKDAVKAWSRKLLENAPGLRVAVGYADVKNSLAGAYRGALDDLASCEEALPFGATLYGLPVVRTCTTTGLPASVLSKEETNEEEWISQSAARKRNQVGTERESGVAQRDIRREFKSVLKKDQNFAIELDKLGGREGESHIAVVHADGNGMGKHLRNVVNSAEDDDADFLHHIREFSASVAHLSRNALKETLQYLRDALPLESLHHPKNIFPLRPIVYGGDDLTFVCDGRLGLDLAAFYLKEFSRDTIKVCGEDKPVDACAGVAIVPTKFPFARAYHFAEELCGLAKSHRRKENNETGSWLDFQIIQEGVTRSLSELRAAQYRSFEGQTLHQRPYKVPGKWDDFVAILKEFQSLQWPRSRAKGLLQALTQGPTATQGFVEGAQWRNRNLPDVVGLDANEKQTGWKDGGTASTTSYFDPLEALDFYLEVKKPATDGEKAGEGDKE